MRHSFVYERNRTENRLDTKDRLLNVEQVRKVLNCSRSHVYKLLESGRLEGITIGGRKGKRVYETEVNRFIQSLLEKNLE